MWYHDSMLCDAFTCDVMTRSYVMPSDEMFHSMLHNALTCDAITKITWRPHMTDVMTQCYMTPSHVRHVMTQSYVMTSHVWCHESMLCDVLICITSWLYITWCPSEMWHHDWPLCNSYAVMSYAYHRLDLRLQSRSDPNHNLQPWSLSPTIW